MKTQTQNRLAQLLVIAALALGGLAAAATDAQAQQVPQVLPYQGYLARANGTPVEGTVTLTFRLYDTAQSQQARWTETLTNVPVADGVFYVYLGQQASILNYFGDGTTRYLGITVNNDPEASPRQSLGSVPYALLAGNALQLGGYGPDYYATQSDIANFLTNADLTNYISENELNQILENYITEQEFTGGEVDLTNYVTQTQLTQALANYVTQDQLNNYVSDAELAQILNNYVTQEQLDNYVTQDQLANYVTQDQLNNYVSDAELTQLLQNYVTQDQFSQLQTQVTNLQTQVTNLQNVVNNLQNNGNANVPYILGKSNDTTTGRINFGGKKGLAGATQMCRTTFANVATAHVCSNEEISMALSMESWDANNAANINNRRAWTNSTQQFSNVGGFAGSTLASSCQNLNYNSGDIARGTTVQIFLNGNVLGNGGQNNTNFFNIDKDVNCGTALPVMCCR
jgi:hypothetical protein